MPADTSGTGCASSSSAVTTAKPPPPPRSAQNSSGSWSASTRRRSPEASTTSKARTLLHASPYARLSQPVPPPSASPVTPTLAARPSTGASPCSPAAAATSPASAPAPARTTPPSTDTSRRREVFSSIAPSRSGSASDPWPVACGATRRPERSTACTSSTPAASTTAAGRWSTERFQDVPRRVPAGVAGPHHPPADTIQQPGLICRIRMPSRIGRIRGAVLHESDITNRPPGATTGRMATPPRWHHARGPLRRRAKGDWIAWRRPGCSPT